MLSFAMADGTTIATELLHRDKVVHREEGNGCGANGCMNYDNIKQHSCDAGTSGYNSVSQSH